MKKELYLYSPIYNFSAEALIASMEEHKDAEVTIRANSPGGSVFAGWGVIAKIRELGNVTIKVDGSVASMAAAMLVFADNVEALDVSKIMLHRADMEIETPEDQVFLDSVNRDIKAKLLSKIDNAKLKELRGFGIEELFAGEKRIDLWLSAKEAKAIGLVNKIVKLNTKEIEAITHKFFDIAATAEPKQVITTTEIKPNSNIKAMNLEKLKAENPALFNEIKALGAAEEKDRVGAWMAFNDIDPEAVAKGIKEGTTLSGTAMAEFARKGMSAEALGKLTKDSVPPVGTKEVDAKVKTEKEQAVAAFEAEAKAALNIK